MRQMVANHQEPQPNKGIHYHTFDSTPTNIRRKQKKAFQHAYWLW